MEPCFKVVEAVEDYVKGIDEFRGEVGIFDIAMVGGDVCIWAEGSDCFTSNFCFALANVVASEEELSVEVAGFYGVKVDLRIGREMDV